MKVCTLKEMREKRNLSMEDVANNTGITKTYLYLLETGQRNPSDKLKGKLASLYGVSITAIFLASQLTKCRIKT